MTSKQRCQGAQQAFIGYIQHGHRGSTINPTTL
jgi:hypothetical protein